MHGHTNIQALCCACIHVRTWYLHLRPQGAGSRQRAAWGFARGRPLVYDADMTAYREAVSQNSVARISPTALTPLQLQYIHLRWLSEVLVNALTQAKLRFFRWQRQAFFGDMSASVSIDKLFLAKLDESIEQMDENDRVSAMRQLNVGGLGVQPNHYFYQYLQAAEPIVTFQQPWVPATLLVQVHVVDPNNDSCDADRDGTTI